LRLSPVEFGEALWVLLMAKMPLRLQPGKFPELKTRTNESSGNGIGRPLLWQCVKLRRCWYVSTLLACPPSTDDKSEVPHIYIQDLCTDLAWQGHGAASKLLQWIFEFGKKENIGSFVLQCSPKNKTFYERFGFKAVRTHTYTDEKLFPGRIGPTIVYMVKYL